jgi:hypothetical protein
MTMDKRSAQIATISECIDHCFAFSIWCKDFAPYLDPEDMIWGLDRAADLVSDATRLQSFLALRKLDDFLGSVKPQPDDLIAANFGIDVPAVLDDVGDEFLTTDERDDINKGVAHLTTQLSPDPDSEVDLNEILKRSMPVFSRLVAGLRAADDSKDATHWLDKTDELIKRGEAL